MPANYVESGYYSVFVSVGESCQCLLFEMHITAAGVFVWGISQWCLQHFVAPVISQHWLIDYSDHGSDCFTQISL